MTSVAHAQTSSVLLRGGYAPAQCEIQSISLDGILLTPINPNETAGTQAEQVLMPLSDCVDVTGSNAAAFGELATTATTFWRARTRLSRGDVTLAEPLFDSLATQYADRTSESAVIVFSGKLESKLRQGELNEATDAWLQLVDITARQAERTDEPAYTAFTLTPWTLQIDDELHLCPLLPPVWFDSPSLQGWSARPGPDVTSSTAITLQQMYQAGASAESGFEGATLPSLTPNDPPGVRLVHNIIASRIGTASERDVARDALRKELDSNPPDWLRAWCQIAVGRSLVKEDNVDSRWQGVVELLRLPAEMPHLNPYLTGLALAEAAVVSAELGDVDGATRLRTELLSSYPEHPVTHWLPIRNWNPAQTRASVP
ncbi:MAG: hypothetical protein H6815_10970 [Phycisphaeraceae bacterium]|nr:hypothetical protein [Phycisphaerales bacterium]MCB9860957.1 hypothetical protein [Phycisphaeraceae bacterium]